MTIKCKIAYKSSITERLLTELLSIAAVDHQPTLLVSIVDHNAPVSGNGRQVRIQPLCTGHQFVEQLPISGVHQAVAI